MVRKPGSVSWFGVPVEQGKILVSINFYGNNGWDRNG